MEAVFAILEHEAMHQETLLYMWHRLPFDQKRKPSGYAPRVDGSVPAGGPVLVPPGRATLGVDPEAVPFAWDNECPSFVVDVPAFAIERHDVTNEAFMEFVNAGGYADPQWWRPDDWAWIQQERVTHPLFWQREAGGWQWRGMFDLIALPPAWPVYVSHAEASAFCRRRGVRLADRGGVPARGARHA
jgi:formylglycine-generating enzyme required for sulfatase activity